MPEVDRFELGELAGVIAVVRKGVIAARDPHAGDIESRSTIAAETDLRKASRSAGLLAGTWRGGMIPSRTVSWTRIQRAYASGLSRPGARAVNLVRKARGRQTAPAWC